MPASSPIPLPIQGLMNQSLTQANLSAIPVMTTTTTGTKTTSSSTEAIAGLDGATTTNPCSNPNITNCFMLIAEQMNKTEELLHMANETLTATQMNQSSSTTTIGGQDETTTASPGLSVTSSSSAASGSGSESATIMTIPPTGMMMDATSTIASVPSMNLNNANLTETQQVPSSLRVMSEDRERSSGKRRKLHHPKDREVRPKLESREQGELENRMGGSQEDSAMPRSAPLRERHHRQRRSLDQLVNDLESRRSGQDPIIPGKSQPEVDPAAAAPFRAEPEGEAVKQEVEQHKHEFTAQEFRAHPMNKADPVIGGIAERVRGRRKKNKAAMKKKGKKGHKGHKKKKKRRRKKKAMKANKKNKAKNNPEGMLDEIKDLERQEAELVGKNSKKAAKAKKAKKHKKKRKGLKRKKKTLAMAVKGVPQSDRVTGMEKEIEDKPAIPKKSMFQVENANIRSKRQVFARPPIIPLETSSTSTTTSSSTTAGSTSAASGSPGSSASSTTMSSGSSTSSPSIFGINNQTQQQLKNHTTLILQTLTNNSSTLRPPNLSAINSNNNFQMELEKELSSAPNGLILIVKEPGESSLIAGEQVDGNLNPISKSNATSSSTTTSSVSSSTAATGLAMNNNNSLMSPRLGSMDNKIGSMAMGLPASSSPSSGSTSSTTLATGAPPAVPAVPGSTSLRPPLSAEGSLANSK